MMQQVSQDTGLSQSETEQTAYQFDTSPKPSPTSHRSNQIGDLMVALAKAQGSIGEIPRNRTVKVKTRSGDEYTFKYATLSAIIEAIRVPLSTNGLAYTQILSHDANAGFFYLTTTLHCGDQFIASKVPLINPDGGNQQLGSSLTYMKRYTLAALLGISADEDDDGNIAEGNDVRTTEPKPPAPDPVTAVKKAQQENVAFTALKIDVPMLPDESGSDWMKWGQNFVATARSAPTVKELELFQANNAVPLKNMEISAPKMYTNLTLALITLKKSMEKKNDQ